MIFIVEECRAVGGSCVGYESCASVWRSLQVCWSTIGGQSVEKFARGARRVADGVSGTRFSLRERLLRLSGLLVWHSVVVNIAASASVVVENQF